MTRAALALGMLKDFMNREGSSSMLSCRAMVRTAITASVQPGAERKAMVESGWCLMHDERRRGVGIESRCRAARGGLSGELEC
jgi:hypothetical protein